VLPERSRLTDDTLLTAATCQGILDTGGADLQAIAARYVALFRAAPIPGIGAGTLKALRDLAAGAHWALAGVRGEHAAGSGAAMRAAPLAFVLDPTNDDDRRQLRDFSRITHHSDEAYAGALAVVGAIRKGCASDTLSKLFADVIDLVPDSAVRDRLEAVSSLDLEPQKVASRFGATGHVADAVPLALYIARHSAHQSLERLVLTTLRCGGDTDTIAALAAQIAGAHRGLTQADQQLLQRIDGAAAVIEVFRTFSKAAAWYPATSTRRT
jgi:ADP-ribosylglycohydrolase